MIDFADQLGHAPTLTLGTYGHVMREIEGVRQSPDEAIAAGSQAALRSVRLSPTGACGVTDASRSL